MKYLIPIFLVLCLSASAGQLVVPYLPYAIVQAAHSADVWDTVTLAGNLTATGNGISIASGCHHWYFNLMGDTISYGTAGGNGLRGFLISSTPSSITHHLSFYGGYIQHPMTAAQRLDSVYDKNSKPMQISGNDILIDSLTYVMDGYSGGGLYQDASYGSRHGFNVEIKRCAVYSNVVAYGRRDYFPSAAMTLRADWEATYATANGYSYNFYVHHCNLYDLPHIGIRGYFRTTGYGIMVLFDSNYVRGDVINLSTDPHVRTSTVNGFGIQATYPVDGSEIIGNRIIAGTNHGGMDGIHLNNRRSTAGGYVEVSLNDIDIHEGPNVEHSGEGTDPCFGIQVEGSGARWWIHNNNVSITTDSNPATTYKGMWGAALAFSYAADTAPAIVENNYFAVQSDGASANGYDHALMLRANQDSMQRQIFRHNTFASDKYCVSWAYGMSLDRTVGFTSKQDTFYFFSTKFSDAKVFQVGLTSPHYCTLSVIQDGIFQNGASDTSIGFGNQANENLRIKYTDTFRVVDFANTPISGALVYTVNAYGQYDTIGLTNSQGNAIDTLNKLFWTWSTPDSTYSPYVVHAEYGADSVYATLNLDWNAKNDTLNISGYTTPGVIKLILKPGTVIKGADVKP